MASGPLFLVNAAGQLSPAVATNKEPLYIQYGHGGRAAYRTLMTASGQIVADPKDYILHPDNKTLLQEQIDRLKKNKPLEPLADWRRNGLNGLTKSLADRAFDVDNGRRAVSPGVVVYRVEDWDFNSSIPKAGAEALPHQHRLIQTAMDAHIQYRNDCRVEAAGKKHRKEQKKAAAAAPAPVPANGAATPEKAADAAPPPAQSRPVTPPNDLQRNIASTPPSNAGWSLGTPFTTPGWTNGSPLQYVPHGLPYSESKTPPVRNDQLQHPPSVATSVGSTPPTPTATPELIEIFDDDEDVKVESGRDLDGAKFQRAGLTLEEISLQLRKARAQLAVIEWEEQAQRLQQGEHVAKRRRMG